MKTAAVLLAFCATSVWCSEFEISTISARPGHVTGGDVLVRIEAPIALDGRPVDLAAFGAVKQNGADITSLFRRVAEPNTYLALLTGLRIGGNMIEVFRAGEEKPRLPLAALNIISHPIAGPVFSGPHQQPFICESASFQLPGGRTLGAPADANCATPTVVQYLYRSTSEAGPLKVLPSRTELPADVATTTTSTGQTVPYIVRLETGTINRAIYQIAVLQNPASEPDPFSANDPWNRRLLYSFGGGCTEGWYRQGNTTALGIDNASPGTLADSVLKAGYAYASASLNVFGHNCHDVTAAETMMMVKERFIEKYGKPLFTFGRGGSGGAYQQVQIAANYPGLLDGIIPSATFPDVLATIQYLTDAQLLHAYFTRTGDRLTAEQKKAIAGVGELNSVSKVSSGARRIDPRAFCPPVLPPALRYHPQTNPTGTRCSVFDHAVNIYGRDPATGFARRPVDNTGVQYGLKALNSGAITITQFLDMNEAIGGHDNDGNLAPLRSVADPAALRAAYSTGRVTHGGGGLASIPILDFRGYMDLGPDGDIHQKYHSFSFRERLLRANGNVANQVLLVTSTSHPRIEEFTIAKMDEWLTNLTGDKSTDAPRDKIVRAKPAGLVDACYTPAGERIAEPQTFDGGECNKLYPTFASPRIMAGGPVSSDILKCQTKAIDWSDYKVEFSGAEKKRLAAIFPGGVCDWTKKGVGQTKPTSEWQSY